MKKFLLAVCTSTPSVKGIYTALFILMLTIPVFSQVEQTDKTPIAAPFHKWEVGFDLKPLFRSDEPYNVLGKWHFTERKAVRVGLGTTNWSKMVDSFDIQENKVTNNNQNQVQYAQLTRNNSKKRRYDVKIGYQYEFRQGKIGIYTATDFNWLRETVDFLTPYQYGGGVPGLFEPFVGYQSIVYIVNKKTTYSLIQSLGFKYNVNSYLSCSFETCLIGKYVRFYYRKGENPYLDVDYTKYTIKGGHETLLDFKPVMGLFINYHF
jgi:hypothetical protein